MTQPAPNQTPESISLQKIFITPELQQRPRRPPEYQVENQGLRGLARELAHAPESILQRVTEVALELCQAPTAGISLLEPYEGQTVFRWRALAGTFAAHLGGMTPRDFSPCGIVVDRRQVQLVSSPGRYYPYLEVQPPIVEALLLPFFVEGEAKGTLWLMAHDEQRKFDAEDARILSSLAEFTAAAYQVHVALAAVRSKQAELERSNRELEQFAAIVSHDLREPLRTVTSFTQLLAQRYQGQLDQEADEFLAFTVAGAKRMEQRIEALLTLARLGATGNDFGVTNLETVLDDVVADLHAQLEKAEVTIQRDPLPTVRGDAGQLCALFQNLLTNAVKYRHPDRLPHVRLSATPMQDRWEIRVADNGMGIAAEHHERVFKVFQRLHTSEEYEGIGLGLAVCKKIVERQGGHIWVESLPGQGATFVFTLPVALLGPLRPTTVGEGS